MSGHEHERPENKGSALAEKSRDRARVRNACSNKRNMFPDISFDKVNPYLVYPNFPLCDTKW